MDLLARPKTKKLVMPSHIPQWASYWVWHAWPQSPPTSPVPTSPGS